MLMIMGTSLAGLTIDNMAHIAAAQGKPIVVCDMGTAPVDAIGSGWKPDKHFLMQGRVDESVLKICNAMGWLGQLLEEAYLPHLCLSSLTALQQFLAANPIDDESMAKLTRAIEIETERERQLYGDE